MLGWKEAPPHGAYQDATGFPTGYNPHARDCREWNPSENLIHVWQVVETLAARGCRLVLHDWRGDQQVYEKYRGWAALFDLFDGHDTGDFIGDTVPLAICRAMLAIPERMLVS